MSYSYGDENDLHHGPPHLEDPEAAAISEEKVSDLVSEMDYGFRAPEDSSLTITDAEICGRDD